MGSRSHILDFGYAKRKVDTEEQEVQRGVFICSYLITRAASESVWYEDARVLLGLNCMLLWRPQV